LLVKQEVHASIIDQIKKFWRRLFFNFWYFGEPPWDTGISPPELMAFIASHPAGKALDMGCGTGTNVITLAKHGWQVSGVDFALPAILQARRKARRQGVEVDLRVENVASMQNISGPFDLILDIGCFHSLQTSAKQAYLLNLERLLAKGGTFLMYAFFQQDKEGGTGLRQADLEALQDLLNLVERQDGTERGQRPSAWFTFRRKKTEA
jgi:2-polyprenyl-3-methyl-5-hydroxy-6-metoxy-1,4-benzoquinol methylase